MNKRKVKIIFFSLIFLMVLYLFFSLYSFMKIEEQENLLAEEHDTHMGEQGDQLSDIDQQINNQILPSDTQTQEILERELDETEDDSDDYAHLEWTNKPFLNDIYKKNLWLETIIILLISIFLLSYTYLFDKSKEYKAEEIETDENIE